MNDVLFLFSFAFSLIFILAGFSSYILDSLNRLLKYHNYKREHLEIEEKNGWLYSNPIWNSSFLEERKEKINIWIYRSLKVFDVYVLLSFIFIFIFGLMYTQLFPESDFFQIFFEMLSSSLLLLFVVRFSTIFSFKKFFKKWVEKKPKEQNKEITKKEVKNEIISFLFSLYLLAVISIAIYSNYYFFYESKIFENFLIDISLQKLIDWFSPSILNGNPITFLSNLARYGIYALIASFLGELILLISVDTNCKEKYIPRKKKTKKSKNNS